MQGGKHSTKAVCRFFENNLSITEVIASSIYLKKSIIMYRELESLESIAVTTCSNINLLGKTTNIFHDIEFVAEIQTARLQNIIKKLYSCTDCSLSPRDHGTDCPKVFMVFFGPSKQMPECYLRSLPLSSTSFPIHYLQSS